MLVLLHFYSARLHAVHAGVPVPALRDRRHRRQSRRRLARHALRHSAHAGDRAGAADRRPACCCRRSIRPGARRCRSPGWWPRRASPGVAKDITKTASKSAIKATSEGGSGQLFRWVAWFTGSKNAMKGVGFFVGGLLLELVGFQRRAVADGGAARRRCFVGVLSSLPRTARQGEGLEDPSANCSPRSRGDQPAGRGAHLPVRLARRLVRRRPAGVSLRAGLALHGGRPASSPRWTIGYGVVQAIAPSVIRRSADGLSREVPEARLWGAVLTAIPLVLALLLAERMLAAARPARRRSGSACSASPSP